VLEDVGTLATVAYLVGAPGATVDYFITNINEDVPAFGVPGYPVAFESPEHKYDAVEVTLNRNFSDNWALVTSYRWAKLNGNFEGFFRSDNGQSDPSITSLFDFPTNDPSYTAIGVPQFGFGGDIRYQGCTLGCGTLPNDRTHQLQVYATRTWGSLNVGLGINAGSGKVLTRLAGNPLYGNSGEIPETIRGGGIDTVSVADCGDCGGFRDKTPFETSLDLHLDYTVKFGDSQRLVLLADTFNLFNRQAPQDFDQNTETVTGTPNPNYGYPSNGGGSAAPGYQGPRQIRLGARIEW
jgi:hypothetical protein